MPQTRMITGLFETVGWLRKKFLSSFLSFFPEIDGRWWNPLKEISFFQRMLNSSFYGEAGSIRNTIDYAEE
jgi:hypothetical protein